MLAIVSKKICNNYGISHIRLPGRAPQKQPKKIDNGHKPLSLLIHSQGLLLISDLIHRKPVLGLTEGGF